ncbi:MAG: succinate dehydrogenase, hydrophobic membrane anchor protein [OCS116 cluster bacterium]|uniref:Succinate dehydrogenase hydrophobic membrane anchor subunit n=1 Tax=OCS116 cluster bacterium TaxID=2030921 RepID=A0A2A4Z221_9PROT|nr:succinate dehydrogenase, hydrophobic membrane anchor protein [OCS116 cluster bacterium]
MSSTDKSNMRTPLSKVRGLGSAKDGTSHFWRTRLTALANIPLALFFIYFIASVAGKSYEDALAFIGNPFVAVTLLLFIISGVYHMKLGMQMIIEDYVSGEKSKILSLMLNVFFASAVGLACVFSIFKISFGA